MNRIVRDHYPVWKLPEDLREGFAPDDEVRVTIDVADDGAQSASVPVKEPGHFSRFRHVRRENYASSEDVVAYVRSLRDEWDAPNR